MGFLGACVDREVSFYVGWLTRFELSQFQKQKWARTSSSGNIVMMIIRISFPRPKPGSRFEEGDVLSLEQNNLVLSRSSSLLFYCLVDGEKQASNGGSDA